MADDMPRPTAGAPATAADDDLVATAVAALQRHSWQEAFDLLSQADARGALQPPELNLLADSAWWIGRLPFAIEVRERAFGAALRGGDPQTATRLAIELARDNIWRNNLALARAWIGRAERLLVDQPENPGHGYLAAVRAFLALVSGDNDLGLREAIQALEIGTRFGDRDLAALATSEKGFALVTAGQVTEGLALIDAATISAVGGELEPSTAGGVYCNSIEACAALGEWNRAAAWTEAQDRWCRREGISGYPGMCHLFRSEIKQLRGSWLEAEAEARQASAELAGYVPAAAGKAFVRIGELRLLRGDLPGAEEALLRGHALGTDPEPILSLLRLAQGRVGLASASIREALETTTPLPNWRAPPGSPLHRLPILRAQVEIALAAGERETARAAVDALAAIAERFGSGYAVASATTAQGALAMADGKAHDAASALRRAVQQWNELAAPHEAARARMLLADAHAADGAPDRALLELHAARLALEQLGATPDVIRVDDRLAALQHAPEIPAPRGGGERVLRTFVFTDIVDSTKLAELLGDEAWTTLVGWHDSVVRSVIAGHGGEEIKATGDGFFLAFPDAGAAVDAAIGIQRRLAEHRDRNGFAPAVRIGLHTAEATRTGLDYLGMGVHYAARIGALATGGEILASASTVDSARRSGRTSRPRTVALKGISAPVDVVSIDWR